jgi:hypothetical protein
LIEEGSKPTPKHVYEMVTLHLKTGVVLRVARNGTGIYHDFHANGSLRNITIPKDNVDMEIPYTLPFTSDDPSTTLQEYYLSIVTNCLFGHEFLRACVITQDGESFYRNLHIYRDMEDFCKRGGLTIDELILHELWIFVSMIMKMFHYLSHSEKIQLEKMMKERYPDIYEEYKKPLHDPSAYT